MHFKLPLKNKSKQNSSLQVESSHTCITLLCVDVDISMCCCWLYRRSFASGRRRKCKLTVPYCFKLTDMNMDNSATSPLAYVVCMFTHHCSPFYSKRSTCVAERKKKFTPYLNHIWTNTLMMWECVRTESGLSIFCHLSDRTHYVLCLWSFVHIVTHPDISVYVHMYVFVCVWCVWTFIL